MKIPFSWLKHYLTCDLTVEKVAEILTMAGMEVDAIEALPLPFTGVVVARVLAANPHPNADKLRVATVTDGTEEFQIVCGAPNCRAGLITALAKTGATLTDEQGKSFKIKKSKLRDVESQGMLCSEEELGLPVTVDGILELSEGLQLGKDLAEIYGDKILEISLTPNLGHCMSMLGIARELSAQLNIPLKRPTISLEETAPPIAIKVSIEDKKKCTRYTCRLVQNVTVGPSPEWLKRKLEPCGMRSVNNVVDVGNLVMLAYGTPLHLFDYDNIEGKTIKVSSSTDTSSLLTLDDKLRTLPPETLLICDAIKPLAVAGIIGGKESAISENTKNVLIEAACFTSESIRKTSKKLGVRTDASLRFERMIDSEALPEALDYAASLLQQVAGGEVAKGSIDSKTDPFLSREILCRSARVNQVLGTQLSLNEISNLLQRLGLEIVEQGETLSARIPSYRNDLHSEIDLIEEVARVYGYNNIFPKESPKHISSHISHTPLFLFEKEVRNLLLAEELQECLTCDLISPEMAGKEKGLIHVRHPSSIEQSVLRLSLLPGLLRVIHHNQDHQNRDISAFEVGKIHFKEGDHFIEHTAAGIVLTGKTRPHHWDIKPQNVDFFDLKGLVENLLQSLGIALYSFEPSHLHHFHPHIQARIKFGDTYVGALGEIHPTHAQMRDSSQRVYFAELNLQDLLPLHGKETSLSPLAAFPGSERDWTLHLKDETPIQLVFRAVQGISSPFLEKFTLLDLYKSEQIGKDRKNATFRFLYRDTRKTIALETVEKEHTRLTQEVANKLSDYLI